MVEADTGKYKRQINRNGSSVSDKKAPPSPQDEGKVRHYNQMWSMILGITLIVCAILSVVIGIIAVISESEFHELGPGIWAGMFFIAPGVFGIVARNKMRCLVYGFLGTSVGSLVVSSNVIVILSIGLSIDHVENDVIAMVVNIVGITVALIAMMTSLFAVILCSIPFCQPPDNRCAHCSSKRGKDNLVFHILDEQQRRNPEQEIL